MLQTLGVNYVVNCGCHCLVANLGCKCMLQTLVANYVVVNVIATVLLLLLYPFFDTLVASFGYSYCGSVAVYVSMSAPCEFAPFCAQ